MSEVQFVRQERQQLLGMEFRKVDAVRCRRICPHEQRQEVLEDFDRQIAEALLVVLRLLVIAVGDGASQRAAPVRNVDAVVGQAHVR